jgi:hypothetical protein
VRLYLDKLSDGGLLALHISNRHLDLETVVAGMLPLLPGIAAATIDDEEANGSYDEMRSDVVFLSKREETIAKVLEWQNAKRLEPSTLRTWTDDYSGVLQAFLRRYWE